MFLKFNRHLAWQYFFIFFFITVQIILVVGFCGRRAFGVYERVGFFSF